MTENNKTWMSPAIEELRIEETANGRYKANIETQTTYQPSSQA